MLSDGGGLGVRGGWARAEAVLRLWRGAALRRGAGAMYVTICCCGRSTAVVGAVSSHPPVHFSHFVQIAV